MSPGDLARALPLPALAGTWGLSTSWECPRRLRLARLGLSLTHKFLVPPFPALALCSEHRCSPRPMLGSGPRPGRAFWLQQDRSYLMLPVPPLPLCPKVTSCPSSCQALSSGDSVALSSRC